MTKNLNTWKDYEGIQLGMCNPEKYSISFSCSVNIFSWCYLFFFFLTSLKYVVIMFFQYSLGKSKFKLPCENVGGNEFQNQIIIHCLVLLTL